MGQISDQGTLSLAAKARPFPNGIYLVAALVNDEETMNQIKIHFKDNPVISDKDQTTCSFSGVTGDKAVLSLMNTTWPEKHLFGSNQDDSLTQEWIDFSAHRLSGDFKTVMPALAELDNHLALKTFIVGYTLTVADLYVWGTLKNNNAAVGSIKKATFINLGRWYKMIETHPVVSSAMSSLQTSLAQSNKKVAAPQEKGPGGKQSSKETSVANFEIGLQDAKIGEVVTRFPPEPSGYLHIGHAKAAMLNQYFAQKYKGKLIIRFDDTNPSKEKQEFEDSIIEDLELLGIKGDVLSYTSDHFHLLYEYALQLIKQGDAYVDDTEQEQMRKERMDGIASQRRDRPVEENLQLFTEEMKKATAVGQKNCLRAKMSVDNPNKAMRDPVIYRCNLLPHHRTGSTWKIYPTYDFCCPIVDSIEGVTHALRTIEYRDRNPQYEWFLHALKLRYVHVWDFARMNFVRTLLSKRKLQWFVDQGHVGGWDDPRFPTVRGIRRRGMTVPALREFILSQGPSRNIANLTWEAIWAINKKSIDPVAPRHTALNSEGLVVVEIDGSGEEGDVAPVAARSEEKPKHKKNPDLGTMTKWFSKNIFLDQDDATILRDGEEFTLMDWGNAIVSSSERNSSGVVTHMSIKLHLAGDFKKTKNKLTWLSASPSPVSVQLLDFDHLISKDKLEEGDDVKDYITQISEFSTKAVADVNVKTLKKGDIIQFERKGYFVVDREYEEGKETILINIPDGKQVSRYGNKNASESANVKKTESK